MKPVIAILGRPNVGKSTLFNRLAGRRSAIVDPAPGVTRDRREADARLGRLAFVAVDTAGLEETPASALEGAMQRQARRALAGADAALLLFDARAGVTPLDRAFADEVRRGGRPVVPVANKCESRAAAAGIDEGWGLGHGGPVAIASGHGIGMPDLEAALAAALAAAGAPGPADEEDGGDGPLRLIIAGRPNVGKSTLMNRVLGDERVITGPEPGTTRDAIAAEWTWRGRRFRIVDTAGLRRKARIWEQVEKLSVRDALDSVRFAHVVVLVLDACLMPERQDLAIARHVVEEGRAVVIAVNKRDAVPDVGAALRRLRDRMEISLPQIRGVPVVALSALTGAGVGALLPAVVRAEETWSRRAPTGPLNRWLHEAVGRHPPPLGARGRPVRLRYVTQSRTRPPTFALFANRPADVPEAYLRYLANGIRDAFGFDGVPIRIDVRRQRNPYAPE